VEKRFSKLTPANDGFTDLIIHADIGIDIYFNIETARDTEN